MSHMMIHHQLTQCRYFTQAYSV